MTVHPATILVVDDNDATRYSTARVLRSAGWKVEEASTGTEAIAKATGAIDLVVLDVNLPDIDGYTVCREIRNRPKSVHMPILHLSASFTSSNHKVTGLDAGADGFLTHPVEPPVLIATVNAFLRTRQSEIELRVSEARFKAVFENALTGVALLDDDLTYVDVNPRICSLLRLDRSDVIGKRFADLCSPKHLVKLDLVKTALSERSAWHGYLPMLGGSGEEVALEWHISIHAEPGLRLAIVVDISDRLRYEAERESLLLSERAARSEAERANRLKDEFLATLSHELRTPLNAIVGWSQLLRMGKLSTEETTQAVEAIERNARAQSQMISDLLDVSRIVSGKLRLNIDKLNPGEVIDAALTAILPSATAKSIRLSKTLDPNCGLIEGDASRLQQIIWNLVNNAVKFTPSHKKVHVSLRKTEIGIEIAVTDEGIGIGAELLPRVFERFHQGDSSSTRSFGGLGLGLAIVKQLVELHQGTISADSAGTDQGATFTIVLPERISHQHSNHYRLTPQLSDPKEVQNSSDLTGARILLVEDDLDSRRIIERIIAERKATVCAVGSVEHALKQLGDFRPSILISDLGMPNRDGFELIGEIRQRGFSPQDLPAIALTAFARPEDRQRALLAGFQIHLAKPIDPHDLTTAIASLMVFRDVDPD